MNYDERALLIDCAGQPSVAVLSRPLEGAPKQGLLVVVGGPQYRVGSHRMFVHLARHVAAHGFAAMRFDYRGMGDSWAEQRDFEDVEADIAAAIDAMFRELPSLERVVLWGLCDGASAACLYAPRDRRVSGLILVNPWVHTPVGASATMLKHYYLKRVASADFWRRLLRGRVSPAASLAALGATLRRYLSGARGRDDHGSGSLPDRMARSLKASALPVAVALSGNDKVAREFEEVALPSPAWREAMSGQLTSMERIHDADHTLASPEWRDAVQSMTVRWLGELAARAPQRRSAGALMALLPVPLVEGSGTLVACLLPVC